MHTKRQHKQNVHIWTVTTSHTDTHSRRYQRPDKRRASHCQYPGTATSTVTGKNRFSREDFRTKHAIRSHSPKHARMTHQRGWTGWSSSPRRLCRADQSTLPVGRPATYSLPPPVPRNSTGTPLIRHRSGSTGPLYWYQKAEAVN